MIDILHIYSGTSGYSGIYIDEIYRSLKNEFNQEVIVNAYFPYNYGKKIYYRYSDLCKSPNLFSGKKIRLYVRFMELFYALVYSFMYILFHKVAIVNYSLISSLKIEIYFLKSLKIFTSSKVIITCHDVIPFQTGYSTYQKDMSNRLKFYSLADKLIVHNQYSKDTLISKYKINENKIVCFPFPLMRLDKLYTTYFEKKNKKIRFSFIGHLRKEKGIDLLIEAWSIFFSDQKNAELIIAGNLPKGFNFNFDKIRGMNFTLINRFLFNKEYAELILESDFIVLPYIAGTNSGIPSSVFSLNRLIIASNINLFKDGVLIPYEFLFEANNIDSLVQKLNFAYTLSSLEKERFIQEIHNKMVFYNESFHEQINFEFSKII